MAVGLFTPSGVVAREMTLCIALEQLPSDAFLLALFFSDLLLHEKDAFSKKSCYEFSLLLSKKSLYCCGVASVASCF